MDQTQQGQDTEEVVAPMPTANVETTATGKRRRRRRKPWYKRPFLIVPLALLGIILVGASVVAYRTMSAFDDVQSISTPPPEISGVNLDGPEGLVIDTGPAQQAIRQREQREQEQPDAQGTESTGQNQPSQFQGLTPGSEQDRGVQEADPTETGSDADLAMSSGTAPASGNGVERSASDDDDSDPAPNDEFASINGTAPASDNRVEPSAGDDSEPATNDEPAISNGTSPATDDRLEPSTGDESDPATNAEPDPAPGDDNESAMTDQPATETDSGVDSTPDSASAPVATVPPSETDGTNILLMGVDALGGESIDVGVRPDLLAVLNLNEETGACRVLAIPRDSRVNLPGYGMSKVNHALAVGGIPYEILVVEDYLGIPIEHYALVDYTGLVQVVDAVGGVTVDNPEAFTFEGATFDAGAIELVGDDALIYARYRGGADGDFGRISRQQQVIRGLMDQVYDLNLVRIVPNMFSLLSDHFRTDYGPTDLIDLANTYRTSCTSTTIETRTIPGDVRTTFDDLMQMNLSFVISDPATVRDDVEWLLSGDD